MLSSSRIFSIAKVLNAALVLYLIIILKNNFRLNLMASFYITILPNEIIMKIIFPEIIHCLASVNG
jgi:hypothetical protein